MTEHDLTFGATIMITILLGILMLTMQYVRALKSQTHSVRKYSSMIPSLIEKYGDFPPPRQWIYSKDDLSRQDEDDDAVFYQQERMVHHIDEHARSALTNFYRETVEDQLSRSSVSTLNMLDICSSWVTHYPNDLVQRKKIRAKGIGMNRVELESNDVFETENDYLVQDLNVNPMIDSEFAANESFDIVTIAVSIDYLVKPREVIGEILRMLKPEGLLILSFSNRMFWTKAFKIWTQSPEDKRVYIASSFLHYYLDDDTEETLKFEYVDAFRIDDQSQRGDPMYVVIGRKKSRLRADNDKTRIRSEL